jgi:hypothetical protein
MVTHLSACASHSIAGFALIGDLEASLLSGSAAVRPSGAADPPVDLRWSVARLRPRGTKVAAVAPTVDGCVEVRPSRCSNQRSVVLAPALVDLLAARVAAHYPDGGWLLTGAGPDPPH